MALNSENSVQTKVISRLTQLAEEFKAVISNVDDGKEQSSIGSMRKPQFM